MSRMLNAIVAIVLPIGLAACTTAPAQKLARYDFGVPVPVPAAAGLVAAVPLNAIQVSPVSWLAGPHMHYRLVYADAPRRYHYAEAQWVAPPSELLELALKQGLALTPTARCRLTVGLDELEQRFADGTHSALQLTARLSLQPSRGDEPLAQQVLSLTQPTATPDARGGVAAMAPMVDQLRVATTRWLASQPDAIAQRCAR